MTHDVAVADHGTLVGFTPLTETAHAWFAEHLSEDAPRMGVTVFAEHRFAEGICEGMLDDGLRLRS